MEVNKIYNEDCLGVLKSMPDKCVDLIVTDPPYLFTHKGGGHSKLSKSIANGLVEGIADIKSGFDIEVLNECWRVCKVPNMYFWCSKMQIPMYLDYFVTQRGCDFEILTWVKDNAIPLFRGHYLIDEEFCLYFRKGGYCQPSSYEMAKTVFNTPINKADKDKWGHPTIKPLGIIKALVANSSKEGDLVLDPFMGSGTTAVACIDLKRDYVGMELDKKWFDVCERRIKITEKESLRLW